MSLERPLAGLLRMARWQSPLVLNLIPVHEVFQKSISDQMALNATKQQNSEAA
jgi:hypothetical protein